MLLQFGDVLIVCRSSALPEPLMCSRLLFCPRLAKFGPNLTNFEFGPISAGI